MKKLLSTLTLTTLLGSFLQAVPDGHTDGAKKKDSPRLERPDWDSIKKRIEGAVERGDLTRDEANQKYAEIKKKMAFRRPGPQSDRARLKPGPKAAGTMRGGKGRPMLKNSPADPLGSVLGSLVQQGKLNRVEAARIRQAAMTSRPTPPPHHRPGKAASQGPPPHPQLEQMRDEMHGLLETARREFEQVREIRMNLQEARHHHEMEMAERRLMAERREIEKQREEVEREENEVREIRARIEINRREAVEKAEKARHQARHIAGEAKRRMMEQGEREAREDRPRERRETPKAERERDGDREREER